MAEWTIQDGRRAEHVLHPSTQGAAEAMTDLAEYLKPSQILDMGCGSGLLSLIALELWPEAHLTATDISEHAMKDTHENLSSQGLLSRATLCRSDGFRDLPPAEYGLILCNWLAEPIVSVTHTMRERLQAGGWVIFSGILAWKAPQVITAYTGCGFELAAEIHMEEWRTLVFMKS